MLKAPSAYSKLLDMSRILTYIAVLLCFITFNERSYASESNDANRRYAVRIDIRNAYISGVCIMHSDNDRTLSSIVNEFGVSALTFSYDERNRKVKIINILKQMNKAYIRKVLKSDLKKILPELRDYTAEGSYTYRNPRIDIRYSFTPLSFE